MPDTIYHIKITADMATMITIHMVEEAAVAAAAAVAVVVDTEIVAMEDKMTVTVTKIPDTTTSLQSTKVVSIAY